MRKGKKVLDLVVAVILFLFACICFISIYGNLIGLGEAQGRLIELLNREWGFYTLTTLAAIVAAYGLFLFLRVFVVKTRERSIRLRHEDGEVFLTESSIESVVACSVKSFHNIHLPDVSVSIHGGKNPTIRSKVACSVKGEDNLPELAEKMQQQVREHLKQYVGFEVSDVEVTFQKPLETQKEALSR